MFVYLTSKKFPASTADHLYILALAKSFYKVLGDAFVLVVSKGSKGTDAVPVYEVGIPGLPRSVSYFFWFPFFILSTVEKDRKVVFSNDLNLLLVAIFWKKVLHAPYVVCADWHLATNTFKDSLILRYADVSITTSDKLRRNLIAIEPRCQKRIFTVHGGVDPEAYKREIRSRVALGLPEHMFLVGYVGLFSTMGKEKGLSTIIEALQYLPADTVVVLVGATPEEVHTYESLAESGDSAHRLRIIPRVEPNKVPSYIRAMDVLVIPYPDEPHFTEFGFPMKVYEYLAAGKPIVYSSLDIIHEVLEGKGTAFTAGDPISLANAVAKIRKRPPYPMENMEEYSWETKASRILSQVDLRYSSSDPTAISP